MSFNTIRTVFGYLYSLLERSMGGSLKRKTLKSIYNYHSTGIGLNTSGQPTESQFEVIRALGTKAVINLAPESAENSLQDEASLVEGLGMTYIHLPVDFKAPTQQDFEKFVQALSRYELTDLWVHCAANMRVSAFVYRYRRDVLMHDSAIAKKDLSVIWEPLGVWRKFVSEKNGQ